MFRDMRRIRQQLTEEESASILKKETSGVLCLLGDEGYPYGVPMSYFYNDGKIYFHCASAGHKIDAIMNYDKCSFTVISQDTVVAEQLTTYFRSVICFGKIRSIDDVEEKKNALYLLANHYSAPYQEKIQKEMAESLSHMEMLELTIEHMTGKEAIELTRMRTGGKQKGEEC